MVTETVATLHCPFRSYYCANEEYSPGFARVLEFVICPCSRFRVLILFPLHEEQFEIIHRPHKQEVLVYSHRPTVFSLCLTATRLSYYIHPRSFSNFHELIHHVLSSFFLFCSHWKDFLLLWFASCKIIISITAPHQDFRHLWFMFVLKSSRPHLYE